jgi:hypothetical protein
MTRILLLGPVSAAIGQDRSPVTYSTVAETFAPAPICPRSRDATGSARNKSMPDGIDHQPDQRAVAQATMCRDIGAVELSSSARASAGSSTGVCPDVMTPRPTHRAGRIGRHDLAGYEPVEQMADAV